MRLSQTTDMWYTLTTIISNPTFLYTQVKLQI